MSLLLDTLLPTTKNSNMQQSQSVIDLPVSVAAAQNEVDVQQHNSLLHPIANIAAQEQQACLPESNRNENNTSTIFINTCVDGTLSNPGLYQEAPPMHDGGQMVDQDDAVFWAGPNQQQSTSMTTTTTMNLQRELSINVALAKMMH